MNKIDKKVIPDYPIDQTTLLPTFTLSWSHYLILMRMDKFSVLNSVAVMGEYDDY